MAVDRTYTKAKKPWIGGPGTWLPAPVESFLGWSLAVGCLSVSGYHYLLATFVSPTLFRLRHFLRKSITNRNETGTIEFAEFPCWLPLTTCSRAELTCRSPQDRLSQLLPLLQRFSSNQDSAWSDKSLVTLIRSNDTLRRLVSLTMRPTTHASSSDEIETVLPARTPLGQQLIRLWLALLKLPPPPPASSFDFQITMIIPAYCEEGSHIKAKLSLALESCCTPKGVEVLVVDAGSCNELEMLEDNRDAWGKLSILRFEDGGGRGPCLNYGAKHAQGRIYTFCHSDTTLPAGWDATIINGLDAAPFSTTRPNSCAFAFGIDTTQEGLNDGPFPPGIRAVETTANLRTHMYSLPYGDQVLSVPAVIFDYVGGFPDQCLMEDYELISLLRRRSALLSRFGVGDCAERLIILGGPPALCSPRRWQKLGVLYVTFLNSKFVNQYARGLSPDALFRLYYGRSAPARANETAPWEKKL